MNGWAVVIIVFVLAMLPWQIFRYARRRNDAIPPEKIKTANRDDTDESSW